MLEELKEKVFNYVASNFKRQPGKYNWKFT